MVFLCAQIELNPLQNPKQLIDYCRGAGIVVEGYCPLAKGKALGDSVVLEVAKRYIATGDWTGHFVGAQ
jgi:diketogulonate reductase-like aldo/keto reductase